MNDFKDHRNQEPRAVGLALMYTLASPAACARPGLQEAGFSKATGKIIVSVWPRAMQRPFQQPRGMTGHTSRGTGLVKMHTCSEALGGVACDGRSA